MKSFAIIGTGAVGGFYGARLQKAGRDVHFLLHSDYTFVRDHGLRIDSKDGNFLLPNVSAYASAADMPACDAVIISLKSYDNAILPEILPHVTHPGSCVLLLQNGLGAESHIHRIAPGCHILGGLSFLCSNKIGPGHIHHLDYGRIALGAYRDDGQAAGKTPEMLEIADHFEAAGIDISLIGDLTLARWMKLVWNVPFNGLTVVLDTTTDRLMANTRTFSLARTIMQEISAGAAALGRTIPETFIEKMLEDTRKMAPYRPSMKLDYDAGRKMETEAIYGEALRSVEATGAAMPTVKSIYLLLTFLEQQRLSTRDNKR